MTAILNVLILSEKDSMIHGKTNEGIAVINLKNVRTDLIGPLKLNGYLHTAKQNVISYYEHIEITPYFKFHQIIPSHPRDLLI